MYLILSVTIKRRYIRIHITLKILPFVPLASIAHKYISSIPSIVVQIQVYSMTENYKVVINNFLLKLIRYKNSNGLVLVRIFIFLLDVIVVNGVSMVGENEEDVNKSVGVELERSVFLVFLEVSSSFSVALAIAEK